MNEYRPPESSCTYLKHDIHSCGVSITSPNVIKNISANRVLRRPGRKFVGLNEVVFNVSS